MISAEIYSPKMIFPVASPPQTGVSMLVIDYTVAAIGPIEELRKTRGGSVADEIRLDNHILTPGLVNAHCHLELGYLRGKMQPGHFTDWVIQLVKEVRARGEGLADDVTRSVRAGIDELLLAGVTCVGDICKQIVPARQALREGPIQSVSFGEVAAIGSRRGTIHEQLAIACDHQFDSAAMDIGLSPHAPYTVEGPVLRTVMEASKEKHGALPVCMHLAELAEEAEFLATLGGRLRDAWNMYGTAHEILDAAIPLFEGGPIRWAKRWSLLKPSFPALLAHVNYADDEELAILKEARASVAYCPRTHDFFGHPPHRFREMLKMGINVCLATDSLASNPDLNLMNEAAHLLRQDPTLSPELLLEMITRNGAAALRNPRRSGRMTGTLIPGEEANLAAFEIPAHAGPGIQDVLSSVMLAGSGAAHVWIRGQKVI